MTRFTMWLAFGAFLALAQQPPPDLILANGKIVTVDEKFSIVQAVAIRGNRFVAAGANQDIARLAGPNTRTVDLNGRTVIPGLIDNHIHLLRAASTWLRELRFDGVESRRQAVEMLRARVKSAPPGEWIYNIGGWTHQQFADDPRVFTREELDRIAPQHPIALQESYYQVFLNSRALQILGIEANKPDPPEFLKGSIQRDAAGRPTGVVRADIAATRVVANKLPRVAPDQ
ncbi:MAG TPA: amidohydrolase family protein, partial [Bryobacteraceae bacterium]|nr:amidohydrolase family protein [Bryobacteraceae bacterium]